MRLCADGGGGARAQREAGPVALRFRRGRAVSLSQWMRRLWQLETSLS